MRINWKNWVWLPAAIWAGVMTFTFNEPENEPITGIFSSSSEVESQCFAAALCVGGGAFLIFQKKWYLRLLSGALLLVGLVLTTPPMPSRSGIKIHLLNKSDFPLDIVMCRAKNPERLVQLGLPSNKEKVYQTAPGEFYDSLEIKFIAGSNVALTLIRELRTNLVIFSTNGIALQPISR